MRTEVVQTTEPNRTGRPDAIIAVKGRRYRCTGAPGTHVLYDPSEPSRCRVEDAVGTLSGPEWRAIGVWWLLPFFLGGLGWGRDQLTKPT